MKRLSGGAVGKWQDRKLIREEAAEGAYEYYAIGRYVVIAPGVCGGRPTFKSTRVEVRTILDYLRRGRSIPDVLKSFPSISQAAVEEAIALAAQALTDSFTLKAA